MAAVVIDIQGLVIYAHGQPSQSERPCPASALVGLVGHLACAMVLWRIAFLETPVDPQLLKQRSLAEVTQTGQEPIRP